MIFFYLLESFGKVCRGSTVTIMSHCLPFFNMMPEGGMKEQANRRSKNPLNDSSIISTSTKNQHITRRKQNASRNTSHRNNRNDRRPASSRSGRNAAHHRTNLGRVSHLLPEYSDINETEWLQAAATNPAFDFLKDPEEDVYTLSDGRPFYDEM